MAYTGYKIIQYIDDNPNSSTYGQTWEERVVDTTNCPEGEDEWTLISSNCELATSGYTGRRINVFYNSTTGEYSSTTTSDVTCSASTLEEIWVDFGDVYCEEREDGTYTGWGIQEQKQTNSNLLNYGEIRKIRVQDAQCIDETAPEWQEITRQCHMIPDMMSCRVYFDGTVDITQIDINPSSPSFNQIRTISDFSEECICDDCDSVQDEWRFVADLCGNNIPESYRLSGLTDDTIYHIYRLYEKCIIDGIVRRTRETNEYSAVTYQTGVSDCMYRWIDTEETVCNEDGECMPIPACNCSAPSNKKFGITLSGGTYSLACDSTSSITQSEVQQLIYSHIYSDMGVNIQIGNCITSIGDYAFYMAGSGSYDAYSMEICIPDNVTTIGNRAFASGNKSIHDSYLTATIGSGITSIGDYAFMSEAFYESGNRASITITINALTPPTLGTNAFSTAGGETYLRINVPCQSLGTYRAAWPQYASNIYPIDGTCKLYAGYNNGSGGTTEYVGGCCDGNILTSGDTQPAGHNKNDMYYAKIGNCITEIDDYAFYSFSGLSSVSFPSGLTTIGEYAFAEVILKTADIPASVTYIGSSAFAKGTRIFYFYGTTPPTIGTSAFEASSNLQLYVPSSAVNAYKAAWPYYAEYIFDRGY